MRRRSIAAHALLDEGDQRVGLLAVVPRKSARLVAKTLKSAIANAENNKGARLEKLWIKEAVAGRRIDWSAPALAGSLTPPRPRVPRCRRAPRAARTSR